MRNWLIAAGVFGFLAVGLGAFGAHALRDRLEAAGTASAWQTAVLYHLVHALALLAVARGPADAGNAGRWLNRAGGCWSVGIVLFSGSLYALALGGPKPVAYITPFGGLAFLGGWVCLVVAGSGKREAGSG